MDNTIHFFFFFAALLCSAIGIPTTLQRITHDSRDGRILGGVEAHPGFAPHMVALVDVSRARVLLCGGSLISSHVVLTAAHCIDSVLWIGGLSPTIRGVIGTTAWKDRNALTVKFVDYINHPAYDRRVLKNDIGVLITEEEVVMNKYVQTIELSFTWVDGGQPAYVTGWGQTGPGQVASQLQLLYVPTTTPKQCIDGIREMAGHLSQWLPPVDPEIEICTLKDINFGMCMGDSGSALVEVSTGRQIGIVSWGVRCARGAPDVFVRVSAYRDWLTTVMAQYP